MLPYAMMCGRFSLYYYAYHTSCLRLFAAAMPFTVVLFYAMPRCVTRCFVELPLTGNFRRRHYASPRRHFHAAVFSHFRDVGHASMPLIIIVYYYRRLRLMIASYKWPVIAAIAVADNIALCLRLRLIILRYAASYDWPALDISPDAVSPISSPVTGFDLGWGFSPPLFYAFAVDTKMLSPVIFAITLDVFFAAAALIRRFFIELMFRLFKRRHYADDAASP